MGTRSAVGTLNEAGEFKGRYIHWDGYPGGVGDDLAQLVERDGAEKVLKVLTEDHYGWSNLDLSGDIKLSPGYDDGRFEVVEGYGIAYTTFQDQSGPDEWVNGPDVMIEYTYAINEDGSILVNSGEGWVDLQDALKAEAEED